MLARRLPSSVFKGRKWGRRALQSSALDLPHPAFADLEDRLDGLPCFRTRSEDCVRVLYEPREFYARLLEKIKSARRRIFIASLYVGKEETELVAALHSALRQNPQLRLTFLVDYLRSTREHPSPSSASLLGSLAAAFPQQVDLRLFHTPSLAGWQKKWVPKRFNEGWGLQHMKCYGFDDDVIMSGANLSRDYFTDRQDRYIEFRSHPPLADFFDSLLTLVSSYSFRILARDTSTSHPSISITWPSSNPIPTAPFDTPASIPAYTSHAHDSLLSLLAKWTSLPPTSLSSPLPPFLPTPASTLPSSAALAANPILSPSSPYDTTLRPVLQMGPFDLTQETDQVVPEIFRAANALATAPGGKSTTIDWTSGYFGLREQYKRLVLDSKAQIRIVSASPEANGFFNSRGVSRFIPPAYTYFSQQFYTEIVDHAERRRREPHVEMREWRRDGWTYHAKGIWLTPALSNRLSSPLDASPLADANDRDDELVHLHPLPPYLTLIGSSNYGGRSAQRDLEANVLVTTHSAQLRRELERELRGIRWFADERVEPALFERTERKVPWGVRVAARAIETML
ncbi:hypothetical protein JCM21900_002651 [Sporobolomyces salmonicolor]